MSDSISKFHELSNQQQPHREEVAIIAEIIQAAVKADLLNELLNKAVNLSQNIPHASAKVIFQIAGDSVKVDELCN